MFTDIEIASPARRRQMVRSMALLLGVSVLGLLGEVVIERHLYVLLGGLSAALLIGLAVVVSAGERLPLWSFQALVALLTVGLGVLIVTGPQTTDTAAGYMLTCLFAAYFFSRPAMLLQVGVIAVVHGVVLATWAVPEDRVVRWLGIVSAALVTGLVLSTVRHRMDGLLVHVADIARTDALTSVLNRRGFDERLPIEIARAMRESASLALITFDLDHFKQVNDVHGHPVGDEVLRVFGRLLAGEARATDIVARIGGEEFAALLPGTDEAGALEFGERIRTRLPEMTVQAELPRLTVSAGIALWPPVPAVDEQLLAEADRALYEAKAGGRDRVQVARVLDDEPDQLLAAS